jgi:hypothetical protein
MPRAALLSIHARVAGTDAGHWEHSSLVQIWGPRFSNYVVAAKDVAVFSLGRLPDDARGRARAHDTAKRLHELLKGQRMPFEKAGRAMGVQPNSLRYAAATGTVLMRWDGARGAEVWTVQAPEMDPRQALNELARRYLHVFGPGRVASFAKWAGIRPGEARAAFEGLAGELVGVRTPIGEDWILAEDEAEFRVQTRPCECVRLLPSGDAYYLLWGVDRELLVPDATRRSELWTTRVWPGAVVVNGEIVGVWRRSGGEVSMSMWRRLSAKEREAVEAEAVGLPIPGLAGGIVVVGIA